MRTLLRTICTPICTLFGTPYAHHMHSNMQSNMHSIRHSICAPYCAPICTPILPYHYPLYYAISDSFGDSCSFFFIFHFFIKGRKHLIHSYCTEWLSLFRFLPFLLILPTIRAPFAHHSRTRVNTCRHTYYPFITPSYYTISHSFGDCCSFFFIFHFFIKGRKLQILA